MAAGAIGAVTVLPVAAHAAPVSLRVDGSVEMSASHTVGARPHPARSTSHTVSTNAPDPALPAKVLIRNGHPVLALNVVIDGEQRARLVPPGSSVGLVLDAGAHVVEASMAALPDRPTVAIPDPVVSRITVAGRALDVLATGSALTVTSGGGPMLTAIPSALDVPHSTSVIRWKAPATLESILAATFGLLCTTGGVIAQLVIGRTRVRDERTMLRMQLAARRSLADLPPLTIGMAARRSAKAPTAGTPPKASERPTAPDRRTAAQLTERHPVRGGRIVVPRRGPALAAPNADGAGRTASDHAG